MTYKTDQEDFWAGEFGNKYIDRNKGHELLASNIALFSKVLAHADRPLSCIEFGANIGMNLKALKLLFPEQEQHAVEINPEAAEKLRDTVSVDNVYVGSILDFSSVRTWDLTLIKGVLIHINPDWLPQVYDVLYRATSRYILLCEYYSPRPVSISYRGHNARLFKRDFCGEILDRYDQLKLIDYGFVYHRDPKFPQDDITWFLIEKRDV